MKLQKALSKYFFVSLLFLSVLGTVYAANSTLYLSANLYNNTRIFNYNISIYNSTGLVNYTAINSTLYSLGTSGTTTSSSFTSVLFSNLSNGSTPQYSYLDYNYNAVSNGELRANITYANGSSALTETDAVSGASGGSFTNNISLTTPIVSIDWQARSPGGVTTVQYTGLSNVYEPGIMTISLPAGDYNVYGNTTGYAVTSANYTLSSTYEERTFAFYTTNSISMSFFDEQSNALLNTTTVTAYITSSIYSTNFTTTNGTKYVDLLYPTNYTITFSAPGYSQREYIYEITNQSANFLSLYLINDSEDTAVLATVFTTAGIRLQDVDLYMQRKNLSGTNYYTVESCTTNALGECVLHAETPDITYRFLLYYLDDLRLDSGDTKVTSSTISFILSTTNTTLQDVFDQAYFQYRPINYSNSTKTFSFYFNDLNNAYDQVCLKTQVRYGINNVNNNTNCTSSNTSTLTLVINSTVGDEWTASSYGVTSHNLTVQIDALSIPSIDEFGRNGLYLFGFILLGVTGFSMLVHPIAPPVVMAMGAWVMNGLGFVSLGSAGVISLAAIAIIIIFVNKRT